MQGAPTKHAFTRVAGRATRMLSALVATPAPPCGMQHRLLHHAPSAAMLRALQSRLEGPYSTCTSQRAKQRAAVTRPMHLRLPALPAGTLRCPHCLCSSSNRFEAPLHEGQTDRLRQWLHGCMVVSTGTEKRVSSADLCQSVRGTTASMCRVRALAAGAAKRTGGGPCMRLKHSRPRTHHRDEPGSRSCGKHRRRRRHRIASTTGGLLRGTWGFPGCPWRGISPKIPGGCYRVRRSHFVMTVYTRVLWVLRAARKTWWCTISSLRL